MSIVLKSARDFCTRGDAPDCGLAFYRDRLVVRIQGSTALLPRFSDLAAVGLTSNDRLHLGTFQGMTCHGWRLPREPQLSDGFSLVGLRSLFGRLSDEELQVAGYALQLLNWVGENRFCGRCGGTMSPETGDRALICRDCRATIYPRISPAVIVAITSGSRLLLARSGRFPRQRMFSVIAGYVEPGETLEDCVRREIREEVGLEVQRIRYFGSQPWPFSGSLMIAFTAEHAGGRIRVDGREILEADWFPPEQLPEIPGKISIARQLIDWFVENFGRLG